MGQKSPCRDSQMAGTHHPRQSWRGIILYTIDARPLQQAWGPCRCVLHLSARSQSPVQHALTSSRLLPIMHSLHCACIGRYITDLKQQEEEISELCSKGWRMEGDGLSSQDLVGVQGSCNLKDQIQHKAAFIKEHMLLPGRPPAFVVGHSIGKHTHVILRLMYCTDCLTGDTCNHPSSLWLMC